MASPISSHSSAIRCSRVIALSCLRRAARASPRAAMGRIAEGEHPVISLASGDRVIFSSRTIPGNEREVNRVINGLILQGVEVITDRTHLVHCSGHPRRGEVERFYGWLRPQVAIPAHGEPLHLYEHARVARAIGVPNVVPARNGDMVLLGPGAPGIIDEIATGRVAQDGTVIVAARRYGIPGAPPPRLCRRCQHRGGVDLAGRTRRRSRRADVRFAGADARRCRDRQAHRRGDFRDARLAAAAARGAISMAFPSPSSVRYAPRCRRPGASARRSMCSSYSV